MTAYRFHTLSAAALFGLLAFAVLAFGAVDTWALTIFEVGVFLLAAAWAVRLAVTGRRPVWNWFYGPLALLVLWALAQETLALTIARYQTRGQVLRWLALSLFFAITCQCFADESIRAAFSTALVWFGFALCAFGLAQYFSSRDVMYWLIPIPAGRPFGPFVNGNHFTVLMELLIPSALLLALRPSEQRLIYTVVYGLMVGAVIVCASRVGTALVAAETVVVLAVTLLARKAARGPGRGRRAWLPVAGLTAATALVFSVAGTQKVLERFQEEQLYRVRWTVVQDAWRLFLERPWSGFGAGTFGQVYPSVASFDLGVTWSHAHNDWLQFAVEWGVAGAASLAALLGLLLTRRWPSETRLRVTLPALAVLIHSWFDFPLQIPAVTAAWLVILAQGAPSAQLAPEAVRLRVNVVSSTPDPEAAPAAREPS